MDDKRITLTQEDTEVAGYPCSDSAGSHIPDVVTPIEEVED